MPRALLRRLPHLLLVLPVLLTLPDAARAQEGGTRFGLGYVANAPEMMAGGSALLVLPSLRGFGVYVDAKLNIDSPRKKDTFHEGMTALEAEDQVAGVQFRDVFDSYQGIDVALVREVGPSLMLYAGAGIAMMTRYREYRDPSQNLGLAGVFVVEAPDEEQTLTNVLAGAIMRISPLLHLQTGFEAQPKGFTVGGMFVLPRR